jgi:hypothetical protein
VTKADVTKTGAAKTNETEPGRSEPDNTGTPGHTTGGDRGMTFFDEIIRSSWYSRGPDRGVR